MAMAVAQALWPWRLLWLNLHGHEGPTFMMISHNHGGKMGVEREVNKDKLQGIS
jgi:hypothetical protein